VSSSLDLLVRGGEVVTPQGIVRTDLGISEGTIVRLAPAIDEPATETLDAAGCLVFPGIIDAHVHFNEPGRAEWEGLATGSAALAAGGGTAFFDMPLNSLPPVLDAPSFAAKRTLAEQRSRLDFALWGGLVPGNLDRLGELAEAGAVGFKAFLCDSGVAEFPPVLDTATLRDGMRRAAALGLPVAVHAEDDALARTLTEGARRAGATDARSWLASRPVEVELAALRRAVELAGEIGCALHVVHVSSPEGIDLLAAARRAGVDVTAETCPHYLLLDEEDVVRRGAVAKCAPPVRDEARRRELWRRLDDGAIDTLGSDHSPAPPALKTALDFFDLWGGISGCQHGFPLLLSEALARAPAAEILPRLAGLLADNPARRFRLPRRKGRLAEGCDGDFSVLRVGSETTLTDAELLYRHRQSPYTGRRCRVRVLRTIRRGRTVHAVDGPASDAPGRFLQPEH
jgi:allantoinase